MGERTLTTDIATIHGAGRLGLTNWSTATTAITGPTASVVQHHMPETVDSTTTTSNKVIIPCQRNFLYVRLLGRDTNNDEIRYHFSLVNSVRARTGTDLTWYYTPILTVDGLMSSSVKGATGGAVTATDFYCDTITAKGIVGTTGTYDTTIVPLIYSPGNDLGAGIIVIDPGSAEAVEIQGDIDGGDGTAGTAWNVEYVWA